MTAVHLALVPLPGEGSTDRWQVAPLTDDGAPIGHPTTVPTSELATLEADRPRWLLDSTARSYPALLAAGLSIERCHDVTLTERILLGRAARFGQPASVAAVYARARGLPVPDDPQPDSGGGQPGLFDPRATAPTGVDPVEMLALAWSDQRARVGADNALKLLVAAESASGLAAVEMGSNGLPWDVQEHHRLLTELLGPRPPAGSRPARLAALAEQISAAFGFGVNPDSVTDLRTAFRRAGFDIESTRSWVLRGVDHPAATAVIEYKELARLYTANGWNWVDDWVTDGRLHSEFVPGGVVSGRWATRGGGGLQIPRAVRGAARARPGYRLVVADAAQLEPRVLAAVSGDTALQQISADGDLYDALAADGFGGDRGQAKLAMLGAMYGQTSGEAGRLLATLRSKYPAAMGWVESAARRGEAGGVVRSVLGRTSPPPSEAWRLVVAGGAGNQDGAGSDGAGGAGGGSEGAGSAAGGRGAAGERRAREYARSWGRFTRNFVIQASAADWASVWLSSLRRELRAVPGAELVFFQHDELVVHAPTDAAEFVAELARNTADLARDLVFPGSAVSTPVRPMIVGSYAEAK